MLVIKLSQLFKLLRDSIYPTYESNEVFLPNINFNLTL